jgi:type IV pilus assembly protein PilC
MPEFYCKTLTPQGQVVRSVVEESSRLACIRKLRRNGLTPITVTPKVTVTVSDPTKRNKKARNLRPTSNLDSRREFKSKNKNKNKKAQAGIFSMLNSDIGGGGGRKKISTRDICVFTQNFYLLKKANFNNIHALSTVIETTENPRLKVILEDILAGVEGGEYMYITMEYYSNVFPYIYINMIKVGELSGSLELSLKQAIDYLQNNDKLTKRIKKILIPNILMFVGLTVGTMVAVVVGVPMLKGIFDSVGSQEELPAVTMWLYYFTLNLKSHWYIIVGVILAIVFGVYVWLSTPKGRYDFDYFKYTMPIFGKLRYLLDFSRLMQCVNLNLQNGMRIQDSLEVSKNVVKNTVMMSMVETAINNIFIGQSWIEPFEDASLGDAMCTEMLKIGMQTDLPEMISKMLEYVETDIDNTLQKIVKVLPEIAYIFVGIVLIFFVVAVLVPVISLYMGSWMFSAYDV